MINIIENKYILQQSEEGTIKSSGQEIQLDLTLTQDTKNMLGGSVKGNVNNSNGSPINGAAIKLMTTNYQPVMNTVTNEKGEYFLPNINTGSYNLIAIAPQMVVSQTNNLQINEYKTYTENFVLNESPEASLSIVTGTVLDNSTKLPVNSCIVTMVLKSEASNPNFLKIAYTNENGEFAIYGLQVGEYLINANCSGYNDAENTTSITQAGQIINLNPIYLTPSNVVSKGTISGVIKDTSGNPINGADIILYKVNSNNSLTPMSYGRTNVNGIYLFTNIDPGNYVIKGNEVKIISVNV